MTFSGGYVSGKEYSADIFGQTVSIIADDNDGFENSLNGLVNQMTQAINDAGIIGVKAAAVTTNTRVSLTAFAEVTNARVTKDQGTVTPLSVLIIRMAGTTKMCLSPWEAQLKMVIRSNSRSMVH